MVVAPLATDSILSKASSAVTRKSDPVAVVPAAGRSERFGGAKLVTPIGGVPMIERVVRSLLRGGVNRVVVVLRDHGVVQAAGPSVVPSLADPGVLTVVNPDPDRGMLSSIQVGLAEADGDPVLILPADMPFVRADTVEQIIAAAAARHVVVSPRFDGRHGHPVAFPGRLRPTVLQADPAADLSTVLEPHTGDRFELDVDDAGVLRDVDRPEDLQLS